ncbi:MAG: polysaccharide biosynthesis protein [Oscillospiraceae bacterium]|nr:polysaccharide biosynthesis protein [Oscillospiraceae bacterium]
MNEKPMKRQSFLHGAAILALGTMLVKLIGACYKIPLGNIIGDDGYGYFTTAYDIYAVLLTISTAGLPVAMSRMISASQALGNNAQIKRVYQASLCVFLPIGILGCGGMLLFSRQLAGFMEQPNAWASIAALAPAVFFVCVISSYRGFFQGQSNMIPTSVSQVFEALCKLLLGLGAAWLVMDRTGDVALAAGGAILGVTVGTVISAAYLGVKHKQAAAWLSAHGGTAAPLGKTVRALLAIAIPITIGAAGLQLINLVDAKIVMTQLKGYLAQTEADGLKGIYNFCQTLFNLPAAFIVPITVSIIPSITGYLTKGDKKAAWSVEESAIRITGLLGLPCGVGLAALASPILVLLRHYGAEQLSTGQPVLFIFGVAVIFNCLVLLTNAIMQAHGNVSTPLIDMLIGGIVKVVVNFILVSRPELNIVGAPIGTLCCYITILALNLFSMRRMLRDCCPRIVRLLAKPLAASLVMGGAAWAAQGLLFRVLGSNALSCLGGMAAAVAVYAVMVVLLRIITLEDCMLLPKGEKLAKLLKIKGSAD